MKEKIQIGIPCGPNSEMFALFLVESIEKTISLDFEHEYILGVNQKGVDLKKLGKIKNAIIVEEYLGLPHSKGHGHCLDLILNNMSAKYGMFVDSDVAFLEKNWDRLMVSKISNDCAMIGTEYHPTDGKVVNFPNVITCLFDIEKIKSLNLTFVPRLSHVIADEENCKWYGVNSGDKVFLDTGCHIAEDFGRSGVKYDTMKIVTPRYKDRIDLIKFMKKDMRGEEYQIDGIPVCTHVGRSLSRNFETDPIINSWKSRVLGWLDGKI